MADQSLWRPCAKCTGMFFNGFPEKGVCPGGGGHQAIGFEFVLPHALSETPTAQKNWRPCAKCMSMFFNGFPEKGRCPKGGGHEAIGFNFVLPHDVPGTPTAQKNWRTCAKCMGMFFNGFPEKGRCPVGGGHQANTAGFNFVLPHDLEAELKFDFAPIEFEDGVPVGGNANLSINQNGAYQFRGHFHNSGAVGFTVGLVWAVKDIRNQVYTFATSDRVAGTFSPGSRDHDWDIRDVDAVIADNWANIAAAPNWEAVANTDLDIDTMLDTALDALGAVANVVSIAKG